jgi:ATP-dependent helicase/nuclease subunit A
MDPQNPYYSYMIEASAGSGKTYQLSKRFLYLVAAGSDPSSILTITFTNKAALEMRERIIQEASRLVYCDKTASEFECKLSKFYIKKQTAIKIVLKKPLSAKQTGKYILSSTQSLKVSTIDSVFFEWMMRFPYLDTNKDMFTDAYKIMIESSLISETNKYAWNELFLNCKENIINSLSAINTSGASINLFDIRTRVEEIFKHVTFIDLLKKEKREIVSKFKIENKNLDIEYIISNLLKKPLIDLAEETKNKDYLIAAINQGCLKTLQELRLITSSVKVSAQIIKGKKREKFSEIITYIDNILQSWDANQKKIEFNVLGESLMAIYHRWYECRELIKKNNRVIEFEDLSKIAVKIFCSNDNYGIQWLIKKSINHLMIDEFQDTSLIQWKIFEKLSEEIVSSYGEERFIGTVGTVFFVGDKKQSIYGFREADPKVMDLAKDMLIKRNCSIIPMNTSYRSSSVVLRFVNKVFRGLLGNSFPLHAAAKEGDAFFFPNHGRVIVSDLFTYDDKDSDDLKPIEKEADFVAKSLKAAFKDNSYAVYDKCTNTSRRLLPSDCCILYRSATNVAVFEKYLQKYKINYLRSENNGFFDRPEVQDVISLFKYIANPYDIFSLSMICKSPLSDVNEDEFIRILSDSTKLSKVKKADFIFDGLISSGSKFIEVLKYFVDIAFKLEIKDLVYEAYEKFGILNSYFNSSYGESKFILSNLERLKEVVFSIESKGCLSLAHLIEELLLLENNDTIGCLNSNSNSVQLMTIHKAKGLEFPFVCLVDTESSWYRFDPYWVKGENGLRYLGTKKNNPHNDIEFDFFINKYDNIFLKESLRLLYVSLTRASQYLMISANSKKKDTNNLYTKIRKVVSSSDEFVYSGRVHTLDNKALELSDNLPLINNRCEDKKHFPLICKSNIPHDVDIINPNDFLSPYSKTGNIDLWYGHKLNKNIKAAIGSFIHNSFDMYFSYGNLDLEYQWSLFFSTLRLDKYDKEILYKNKESIFEEINRSLASCFFTEIKEKSDKIYSERPVVFLDNARIIRGCVDLCVYYSFDFIRVIEYKCTEPQEDSTLFEYCLSRGYDKQVKAYYNSIKNIEKSLQIEAGIWLTKKAKYVKII